MTRPTVVTQVDKIGHSVREVCDALRELLPDHPVLNVSRLVGTRDGNSKIDRFIRVKANIAVVRLNDVNARYLDIIAQQLKFVSWPRHCTLIITNSDITCVPDAHLFGSRVGPDHEVARRLDHAGVQWTTSDPKIGLRRRILNAGNRSCSICTEENVKCDRMSCVECGGSFCADCCSQFRKFECPFCRDISNALTVVVIDDDLYEITPNFAYTKIA